MRSGCTLIVFAREPVPGRVKTRLIPALGSEGAARLYRRLLGMALQAGSASACARLQLWCAGVEDQAGDAGDASSLCTRLAAAHGFSFHPQPEGDLGTRMAAALDAALIESDRAVLIGSDCPDYAPNYLDAGFAALDDHDAVLGPAADGGYVLIGLRRPAPELFTGITWGSASVLTETQVALREAGLNWFELPTLRDLDCPADLGHCLDLLDHR
ncbi:TIGR04282 family arsenosugar biosynthesis glycosyltransferase [Thiorhodovibrio winogradskyi]|nr:TIGR04282 family arsenosugar biosynthesis glycosyltransferase [Thiorhodovibrio winogradskyi]